MEFVRIYHYYFLQTDYIPARVVNFSQEIHVRLKLQPQQQQPPLQQQRQEQSKKGVRALKLGCAAGTLQTKLKSLIDHLVVKNEV